MAELVLPMALGRVGLAELLHQAQATVSKPIACETIMGVNISRFMAPIVARFIVDFGGRSVYAMLQLVLCTLGALTVYKTVSLVWQGTCCVEDALEGKVSLNTEDVMSEDKGDNF